MVENRLTERGIDIAPIESVAQPIESEETTPLPVAGGEEDKEHPSPEVAPMRAKKKKRRVVSISSFMR